MGNRKDKHGGSGGSGALTENEQAPPFLAVAGSGRIDRTVNLDVGFSDVGVGVFGLGLDVDHGRFLLDHSGLDVLEQLGELFHLSFDFLDRLVSALDRP